MTYNRVSPLKHCLVCFAPTQVPHLTSSRQLSFSEHIIRDSYSHTASSHCVLSSIRLISTRQPNKLPARLTSCCKRAQPYHPSLSLCKLVKATNHSIALRVHISNKSRRHKKGKTSILSCPRKKKKTLHKREAHKTSESSLPGSTCYRDIVEPGVDSVSPPLFFSVPRNLLSPDSAFGCRLLIKSRHLRPSHSTLYLLHPSISLALRTAHLAFFYFLAILGSANSRSASIRPPPTRNPVPLTPSPLVISPTHSQRYWTLII